MDTTRLKSARKHFVHDLVPRHTARHNIRAWVRMVRMLGDKWLGLPVELQRAQGN